MIASAAPRMPTQLNVFDDPKVGGLLIVSGRQDRDLLRILIMNERVEAVRPIPNLVTDASPIDASYVVATYAGGLVYAVVVDDLSHSDGRLSEMLRDVQRQCRLRGGRLQVWTRRRIERAYPAAVARMYASGCLEPRHSARCNPFAS